MKSQQKEKLKEEGIKIVEFAKANKSKWRYILYGIGILAVLYGAMYLFTPKPQMPVEYKAVIDSLTVANSELEAKQIKIDSSIQVFETEVKILDLQVDNIKEQTTIIREFYHEKSTAASNYNPTQIDSFFKARYNY
jgi:hypothetical protein